MEKVRGTVDRFEGEKGVVRANGDEIIIPAKYLGDFKEGDTIAITLATDAVDTEKASEVAKVLVSDLLKEE